MFNSSFSNPHVILPTLSDIFFHPLTYFCCISAGVNVIHGQRHWQWMGRLQPVWTRADIGSASWVLWTHCWRNCCLQSCIEMWPCPRWSPRPRIFAMMLCVCQWISSHAAFCLEQACDVQTYGNEFGTGSGRLTVCRKIAGGTFKQHRFSKHVMRVDYDSCTSDTCSANVLVLAVQRCSNSKVRSRSLSWGMEIDWIEVIGSWNIMAPTNGLCSSTIFQGNIVGNSCAPSELWISCFFLRKRYRLLRVVLIDLRWKCSAR